MPLKIKALIGWLLIHQFACAQLPSGFTVLNNQIPELEVSLRYATSNNFMGRPVAGYKGNRAVGSVALAVQLKKIQEQLTDSLAELLKDKGNNGIGFVPTIRNVLAVIFANGEAFLRLLDNKQRNRSL